MTQRIRPESNSHFLHNDGDVIFLYDEGSTDLLSTQEATRIILGDDEEKDQRLKQITQESLIVCYQLIQDDERQIEVVVGEPLTAKEKKVAKWHKAQKSMLNLPSGRLRVESYNSLSLSKNKKTHEGWTVDVQPGSYLLTLHRINWEEMESGEESDPRHPDEFITLTPIESTKPTKLMSFLSTADLFGDKAAWELEYSIKDGVFHGLGMPKFKDDTIVNFTLTAAKSMGIRIGEILHIQTPDYEADFLYFGRKGSRQIIHLFGQQAYEAAIAETPLYTNIAYSSIPGSLLMGLSGPDKAKYRVPAEGTPVTITRTGCHPFPELDNDLFNQIEVRDGEVVGRVLFVHDLAIITNLNPVLLKPYGYKPGQPLLLNWKDQTRRVFFNNPPSLSSIKAAQIEAQADPSTAALLITNMEHWDLRGRETWDFRSVLVTEPHHLPVGTGDVISLKFE